jgi:hypothetical protein
MDLVTHLQRSMEHAHPFQFHSLEILYIKKAKKKGEYVTDSLLLGKLGYLLPLPIPLVIRNGWSLAQENRCTFGNFRIYGFELIPQRPEGKDQ